MSIDWKDYYPNGAVFELNTERWGQCEDCNSGLHNLGAEYEPEDMRSYESIVCPNCQKVIRHINAKWHAPDGLTFPHESRKAFIEYLEATGDPLPACIQEDLAFEAQDREDMAAEYDEFKAAWERDEP